MSIDPGDVVLMWNRYGENHDLACRAERAGATVLVAENGYLHGRHDGGDYYALAIGGHNGSGRWHVGGRERWDALGVELKPWRTDGEHIVVAPNRPFGRPDMMMPLNWASDAERRLRRLTTRPIKVRAHPGNNPPTVPLEDDLRAAWAVVIWASSAGVKALVDGVPVICEAPYWICKGAADANAECVEKIDDRGGLVTREAALRRLAWAQWSVNEIASGEPFRYLLSDTRQAESAAAL